MTEWNEQAKCRGSVLADRFFDDDPSIRKSAAVSFCSSCPVRYECLQEGFNYKERFGVRGGVDQDKLREAQHIDSLGKPSTTVINSTTCMFCDTKIELKGSHTQRVNCPVCEMTWEVVFK